MDLQKKKKIIFLGTVPLTKRDYERFGFDFFIKNNVEVYYLECNFLIPNQSLDKLNFSKTRFQFSGNLLPKNLKEAVSIINKHRFEFIVDLFDTIQRGEAIVVAARRYGRHIKLRLGFTPFHLLKPVRVNTIKRLQQEIGAPLKFLTKLIRKISRIYFNKTTIQNQADYYVVSGLKSHQCIEPSKLIYCHNLDYDLIKDKKQCNSGNIVFLDEDMPFHPDYSYFNITSPVNHASYYLSLNIFLRDLEKYRREKVLIALHPRAEFSRSSSMFQFEVIQGNSVDLVNGASLVIAHSSTSIQFAVIFKKPILLLTTNEIVKRLDVQMAIDAFSFELGCAVINIDEPYNLNNLKVEVDEEKYSNYFHNYIKSPMSQKNKSTWEIFLEYINKYE
jgi:hypothetical protein